jgi:hypothetical protein
MTDEPAPGAATLSAALVAFQAEAPTLAKNGRNPHFNSKFVPLDTIVETIQPLLATHGLAWVSMPGRAEDGTPVLKYRLLHGASGDAIDGEMPLLLQKQDPQGQGSAITYARRYALLSVLNLVADDDDDGNKASQKPAPKPPAALTDDKAKSLRKSIEAMYEDLIGLEGGSEAVPRERLDKWLLNTAHSHEDMERLLKYVTDQRNELAGKLLPGDGPA